MLNVSQHILCSGPREFNLQKKYLVSKIQNKDKFSCLIKTNCNNLVAIIKVSINSTN